MSTQKLAMPAPCFVPSTPLTSSNSALALTKLPSHTCSISPRRIRRASRPQSTRCTATVPAPSPTPAPDSGTTAESSRTRFGFASLLGPSNSGKSTLLNRLVGSKVAIVTPKEQTTRCRVSGIAMFGSTQVAFLDTPGIFEAHGRFDRAMVKSAWTSGKTADATAVVMDAAEMHHVARKRGKLTPHLSPGLELVVEGLVRRAERAGNAVGQVCFLANKMDKIAPQARAEYLARTGEALAERGVHEPLVLPISALDGDGVDAFIIWCVARMPVGPWLYPEDYMTDMSSRLLAAEVTREKLMLKLKQELPYEIAVETTEWSTLKDGSIRILQDVLVRRDSQIGIVTGKGGAMVKSIGIAARTELREILGTNVHLIIKVKVRKWKDEAGMYSQWGLDYQA